MRVGYLFSSVFVRGISTLTEGVVLEDASGHQPRGSFDRGTSGKFLRECDNPSVMAN